MSLTPVPGLTLEHLVSMDSDRGGGVIVGARLLDRGSQTSARPSLLLTRFARDEGEVEATLERGASDPSRGAQVDTMLITESPFAYLGQPYVVAPDGRVFQPVASEAGYSILVHSFAKPVKVKP